MSKKIEPILDLYYKIGPDFIKNYNNEDLFKIYLLILKENEKIHDKKYDIRLSIILSYLDPILKDKLKDIIYVNKGIDLDDINTIEYKENDCRIYLFDKKDMDDIKIYQINPYSGRIINENFFNKYFPNDIYNGYDIENKCTTSSNDDQISYKNAIEYKDSNFNMYIFNEKDIKYIKKYQINPYTSEKIEKNFFKKRFPNIKYIEKKEVPPYSNPYGEKINIIYNWIYVFKKYYKNYIYHRYNPKIIRDLNKYRKCEKYKIYRGINFDKSNIDKINNFFNLKDGDDYIYESNIFSSWTLDKNIAENFSKYSIFGFVMSTVVNYTDILIDTVYFEEKIKSTVFSHEKEIILLPGKYETKLSHVKNAKDEEELYITVKLNNFLEKNIDQYCKSKLLNKDFFLKIEKDLKSIQIYFEKNYPIVFCHKKNVYIINPYEKFKIEFQSPSDLYYFIKQNIIIINLLIKNRSDN